jgi:ABC-type enterochelin transport system substrate-binding protein
LLSQTELLHDLGLEARMVELLNLCASVSFKSTKTVGGTKKVNYRKIRELQPDALFVM